MDIAPLRGLRFDLDKISQEGGEAAAVVTAPPYDVLSPEAHRALLDASSCNIVRLTLGDKPGETPSYEDRARLLESWIESGILVYEDSPVFYVCTVDYTVPGTELQTRMVSLVALGRLHEFQERIVQPHEQTFPKIVADRQSLLEATRCNLESIMLLYNDDSGELDSLLEDAATGEPVIEVEASPGEVHGLYPVRNPATALRLTELMGEQHPIIADGHHRYTTALLYRAALAESGRQVPGSDWKMMTFANLRSEGVSILATHRLLKLLDPAEVPSALELLDERLEPAGDDDWEIRVETAGDARNYRLGAEALAGKQGAAATSYGLVQDEIIGSWLAPFAGDDPEVFFYKEGTGEDDALREGKGELLFRMRPVGRSEFQAVIDGSEVFPHKTTYFYPKLWSGLVLWRLEDTGPVTD
ncbi:MAG: DUF1015 domain-containing protein [Planctomycetota bacterium]|mgnify:FL=1|nr:hypothetical protein [Planctomycetota bacterium]MEE3053551.1 DUF1015 domain-containing protein [Planctomycetota bacterium]